ncbi:GNAT family N-acetyltransferase [Alkalicella caledoniensis]|uniref:GNAT family N-acetyltransferase n=1 Tax=Alkalicella caledoniensis TaxID=2731377 RepID=A0A7G9W7A0_ALKCA|nr:GNAT family protein [Alkalicella caledoniensis]QNO14562.1 GNAT family N-acetyltransferase [Alkalicella caledoniensis]
MSHIIELLDDYIIKEMMGTVGNPTLSNFTGKSHKCFVVEGQMEEFIGIVELFNICRESKRAELSIAIKPTLRGKGYGHEALERILEIGFEELGLNKIWLRVMEHNNHAINLYGKIGFVREGLCREKSLRNGSYVNQIQMSILRKEWEGND